MIFEELGVTKFYTCNNNFGRDHIREISSETYQKYTETIKKMSEKYGGEVRGNSTNPKEGKSMISTIDRVPEGFWSSSEVITSIVNSAVNKEDNRNKLGKEKDKINRRELFILINSHCNEAHQAMCNENLPSSTPQLPYEITGIWAAAMILFDEKGIPYSLVDTTRRFVVWKLCYPLLKWEKLESVKIELLDLLISLIDLI